MSTPSAQLDHAARSDLVLDVLRQLLRELGSARPIEELARRGSSACLESDLGLGSLERVELMLRLDAVFGVRLPEQFVAGAQTVGDVIAALAGAESAVSSRLQAATPLPSVRSDLASSHGADFRDEMRDAETLTEILLRRGRAEAAKPHIYLYEDEEKIRTITFGELLERASAVAAELARRGFSPGRTVAILLPTCAEFFWVFAGILLAGGIPVPLYPPLRADQLEAYATRQAGILRNAEASFLITSREGEGIALLLKPHVPSLRGVLNASRLAESACPSTPPAPASQLIESLPWRRCGEDIAFLQYTSGSTGDPKGVVLTHANLLAHIRCIGEAVEIQPSDIVVSWLPLYHDMGLIGAWFTPLYFGFPLVLFSPLAFLARPERWLWAIHRHRGTLSPAPNFAYELCVRKIADRELKGLDLRSWRAAFNGAEPIHKETLERFSARFERYGFSRQALLPVYGLAEACLGVAAPPVGSGFTIDRIEREAFERDGRAVPASPNDAAAVEFVSVGKPLPGVEVQLTGEDGREVGDCIQGHLWFRGPSATQGYYRNAAATKDLLRSDGWLDSGDLAYRADRNLFITGRAKDIIIKGGRNFYPHEIEATAGSVAGVRPGCVVAFGVADERSGTERIVIAAEVRHPAEGLSIAGEITRRVAEILGQPPDAVEILRPHSIPKTSSGKLRRAETRRLYQEGRLSAHRPPAWLQVAKLAARGLPRSLWRAARRYARRMLEIAYGPYAMTIVGLTMAVTWLVVWTLPNRRWVARLIQIAARAILILAVVPMRVEGRELLDARKDSGPWIFAPNHSSFADILAMLAYLPSGVRFVAKGEVLSMPVIGTLARRAGHFFFDRGDPKARVEQSEQIEQALRRGESVVVYPEGTFTAAPGIRQFQLGAFKAAVGTGRPICPAATRGAREILPDKTFLPRPGRITLVLGPLLWPASGKEAEWQQIVQLRDATREILARGAGEPLL